VRYAIRIPANKHLELEIEDILFRSPGRPSQKPLIRYKSFHYQADSWTTPRRVVAKVEHHAGELFPRVGFIVTNLPLPNRASCGSITSGARPSNGLRGRRVARHSPGRRTSVSMGDPFVEESGPRTRSGRCRMRPINGIKSEMSVSGGAPTLGSGG